MHVLIAHSCSTAREKLREKITSNAADFACVTTSSLTETYNYAEHNNPDCVLIADALANCPEFEILASLFRIMHTGCVVMMTQDDPGSHNFTAKDTITVSAAGSAVEVCDAIRKATFVARRKHPFVQKSAPLTSDRYDPRKILLIGASTGGIDALCQVIGHFCANCPPTMVVQHTGGRYAQSLIRLLDGATDARVEAAQDGKPLCKGHIYLAPGDATHLALSISGTLRIKLLEDTLISGHRPSIDALFSSAIGYAPHVVAALLTGMGRDGAQGLLALRHAGAVTLGQDEATSVVYGMPRMAMEMGAVTQQLPIQKIGPALLQACHAKARA